MRDGERNPHNTDGTISEGRQVLYYLGMLVSGIGLCLFLSNFVFFACAADELHGSGPSMSGFTFRGVGGIVLIWLGTFLRNVGARGLRGSGLILDPKGARRDLKPYTHMAGGMLRDAVDASELKFGGKHSAARVMVRCGKCHRLNEEDARFCQGCGGPMAEQPQA